MTSERKTTDRGAELIDLVQKNDIEKVTNLLSEDIVNYRERGSDRTPLSYAKSKEMVDLLVSKKGNVNMLDKYRISPLTYALAADHKEAAVALLAHKANPNKFLFSMNVAKGEQRSPLEIAIEKKDKEMIKILIQHGADPTRTLKNNAIEFIETPLKSNDQEIEKILAEASSKTGEKFSDLKLTQTNSSPSFFQERKDQYNEVQIECATNVIVTLCSSLPEDINLVEFAKLLIVERKQTDPTEDWQEDYGILLSGKTPDSSAKLENN